MSDLLLTPVPVHKTPSVTINLTIHKFYLRMPPFTGILMYEKEIGLRLHKKSCSEKVFIFYALGQHLLPPDTGVLSWGGSESNSAGRCVDSASSASKLHLFFCRLRNCDFQSCGKSLLALLLLNTQVSLSWRAKRIFFLVINTLRVRNWFF